MKSLKVCVLLIVAWAGALALMVSPLPVRAQSNPPFQNPALDSNCYFPQIGDPSEMDTIMGSDSSQDLGGGIIKNLGPKPGGGYGNMFIENLVPPPSSTFSEYTLSEVATGPTFNLHKMVQYVQKFDPDGQQNDAASGFHLGHFRDRNHLDMFVDEIWRIYWADDNGNYDTTRFSRLRSHLRPGNAPVGGETGRGIYINLIAPYVAHLTSDTVDDIIINIVSANRDTFPPYNDYNDTAYLLQFQGRNDLAAYDTIFEDTSVVLGPTDASSDAMRACTQADFRGVGRDDLIVSDNRNNLCYYKNDQPFSLQQLAQAVANDTIFAIWQNPQISYDLELNTWFTMRALPKAQGDKSVDFMPVFDTVNAQGNTSTGNIFIFRGGTDFGSHRFTLDSAAFVITNPFGINYSWPYSIADAGDMTGTGNHVLYTAGAYDVDNQADNFYVMGQALDDKIDIYNVSCAGSRGDTLTANNDSLEDFLLARARSSVGSDESGTLWLYYGSKQIPVHLNPQWADVKTKIDDVPKKDGAGITLSPNPANSWTVATIVWPENEEGEYIITDMLGREVQRDQIQFLGGGQENRISFPELAQGAYAVTLVGQHGTATARMIKLAAASAPQSGNSKSFMQSLHNAAQGNVSKFPGAAPLLH